MSIAIDFERNPYRVAIENNEFVIRVNRDLIEREDLNRLLDYLMLQSIKRRSQASEAEIEALSAEVKVAAWQRVQHLFEPVE